MAADERTDHLLHPRTAAEQLRAILAGDEHADGGRIAALAGQLLGEYDQIATQLSDLGDQAVERMTDQLMADMRLRSMQIRSGNLDMDIAEARELTAMYVGAARAMLGDAENYSETRVSFTVKVAESPESYVLTVQRAGKLTPHEARMAAEAERNQLRTLIGRFVHDNDDCQLDHHGGCQAHGHLEPEPGQLCPHAEAKQLLGRTVAT